MRDDRYFEVFEQASNLSEYYSEQTGTSVEFGFDDSGLDLWVRTPRSGKEYVDSYGFAEERVRNIYSDLFLDDDYSDPLADI
jgi:hypothetical protein